MIKPDAVTTKTPLAKCHIGFRINGLDAGETITAATAVSTPAGLTLTSSVVIDGIKIAQFIAGGSIGAKYRVRFHYTTSAGQEDDLDFIVKVIA